MAYRLTIAIIVATLWGIAAYDLAIAHHWHWLGVDSNGQYDGHKVGNQDIVDGEGYRVCLADSQVVSKSNQAIANWESYMGWQMWDVVSCGSPGQDFRVRRVTSQGHMALTCIWLYRDPDSWDMGVSESPDCGNGGGITIRSDAVNNLSVYSHEFGHTLGLHEHYNDQGGPLYPCSNGWVSTMNTVDCYPTPQAHDKTDLQQSYTPFATYTFWVRPDWYWVRANWGCSTPNEQYYDLEKNPHGMLGQWEFVALFVPKNTCTYLNLDSMGLPPLGGEHCYRVKPWNYSLGLHGPYAPASCVARNHSGPTVTFIENRGTYSGNSAEYYSRNNSTATITIRIYDGVWWQEEDPTQLIYCYNVPPGGTCQVTQPNRAPGGVGSILIMYDGQYYGDTITVN